MYGLWFLRRYLKFLSMRKHNWAPQPCWIFKWKQNPNYICQIWLHRFSCSWENDWNVTSLWNMKKTHTGLDINICPIPVKTDVGQVDLVLRLSDGQVKKSDSQTCRYDGQKSISTGIKYWVCCMKEPNLSIIYFD